MPKTTSRWGVVGMLMGAPKLRSSSKKAKGKQTTKEELVDQRGQAEVEVPVVEGIEAGDSVDGGHAANKDDRAASVTESFTDVQLPAVVVDHDQGWTSIASRKQLHTPSAESIEVSPVTEDLVDVLSQSVSAEFLNRQTQPSPDSHVSPFEEMGARITILENEKEDAEDRLKDVSKKVEEVNRRNSELFSQRDQQAQELLVITADQRRLVGELDQAKKNVREGQERIQGLEEVCRGQSSFILGIQDDLKRVGEELEQWQKQTKEVEELNRRKEERIRQLMEERQVSTKELQTLRGIDATMVTMQGTLDSLEQEGSQTLARLDKSNRLNMELEERHRRDEEELLATKKELEEVTLSKLALREVLEVTTADYKSAMQSKADLHDSIVRKDAQFAQKEKEIENLRRLYAGQAASNPPNKSQVDILERRNRMLVDQLRHQSNELRQKPVGSDSTHPGDASSKDEGSVVHELNVLNSEIFQVAAQMAEILDFTCPPNPHAQEIVNGAMERTSITLGAPLSRLLQWTSSQLNPDFNPLPIQIGLQTCLVNCCAKIIGSWYPGHWDYGDFLAAIHLRMLSKAPRVAAGWRAATERQLKYPSDQTVQTEMEEYLLKNIADVLVISGWHKTQSNAKDLVTKFRERLGQVARLALRLNIALGDGWEVLVIDADEVFEPNEMDDGYGGGLGEEAQTGDQIVCTTDLGLTHGENVVLKPKIVLRAMLTEETGYDSF